MDTSLLEVSHLDVSYGVVQVLRDVTLKAKEEQITAIVGPNGAGKTTLLKGIIGYLKASNGAIQFKRESILGMAPHLVVSKGIGYVPQGRGVFPEMTALENLEAGAYTLRRTPDKVEKLKNQVYEIFPRLKERFWQKAGTLSGGERQMLAIARALMAEPSLLILDEPSLGLSPIVLQKVYKTIKELKKRGVSILLVEQNAVAAMSVSDYIYILDLGQIRTSGPKEQIMNQPDIKRNYFGLS
jgi:branched-chain amino acid transport system ATP-binding protein